MNSNWGNGRSGYLGEPPRQGGFGRKHAPLNTPGSESFTLSQSAEPPAEAHFAQPEIPNDIDFSIGGGDMQYVEIELDPGESVIAEPGSMIWKDSAITFDTILGDGSARNEGLGSKIVNAAVSKISGESLFVAEFRNEGAIGKARVAFGGRVPGNIIPVRLEAMGGSIICQRRSFLAAAKGVSITIAMQRKIGAGLFGEDGFIMQRLTGKGWAFLHVGGSIIERTLERGEIIHVDGGCVAAHEPEVEMDIDTSDFSLRRFKGAMFGGENFFMTVMRGPGKVWMQTLPFSRLAAETLAAAPSPTLSGGSGVSAGDVVSGLNGLRSLF